MSSQSDSPMLQQSPAETSKPSPPAMGLKRQFAWSLAPVLVVTLLNLVSVRLFFAYLGDEKYALWGYVATFSGMFGFADFGLGAAVGRYIGIALARGDREAVREYWGTGNLMAIPLLAFLAVLFAVLGFFLAPLWFNISPESAGMFRMCFVIGGFGLFMTYYSQFWLILAQAHLDFKFAGILRTGASVLHIVPSIVLAWMTGNPMWLVAWGAFVALLQLLAYMWHARRTFHLGLELGLARRARLREMRAFMAKTFAALICGSLTGSVDRFILGRVAPREGTDFTNYTNGAANVGARLQGLGVSLMGPVIYNTARAVGDRRAPSSAAIYNETFDFAFGWYLLAAVWTGVWHPVFLATWLGAERGLQVSPLLTPMVVAYCLTAISSISAAQLSALDRVGTALGFTIASGVLSAIGVYVGWQMAGIVGVAYGFLFSRIAVVAQDIFTISLIEAKGWFSAQTWKSIVSQCLVGGIFASAYLVLPRHSFWLWLPAAAHGAAVAFWLARHHLRKFIGGVFAPQAAGV